jgi:hypothetical protein
MPGLVRMRLALNHLSNIDELVADQLPALMSATRKLIESIIE